MMTVKQFNKLQVGSVLRYEPDYYQSAEVIDLVIKKTTYQIQVLSLTDAGITSMDVHRCDEFSWYRKNHSVIAE